jgi:hypothetical protein
LENGTRRSLRTDPPARLRLALLAGFVLTVYTAFSRVLHPFAFHVNVVLSMLVVLPLVTLAVFGLTPLRRAGNRLLVISALALAPAVLFSWLGWVPFSNLAKIGLAVCLGFWIAEQVEGVAVIVLIAALSAAVDIYSVFAGPTKVLLAGHPAAVGYFTVAITWFGYSYREAYSQLGTSDFFFFSLYLGAVEAFGLRVGRTLVFMTLSFLVTVVAAFWTSALPALPLLALAFVAANYDLLWENRRLRRARLSSRPHGSVERAPRDRFAGGAPD